MSHAHLRAALPVLPGPDEGGKVQVFNRKKMAYVIEITGKPENLEVLYRLLGNFYGEIVKKLEGCLLLVGMTREEFARREQDQPNNRKAWQAVELFFIKKDIDGFCQSYEASWKVLKRPPGLPKPWWELKKNT